MSKALLDTTVLVGVVLDRQKQMRDDVLQFASRLVPAYAVKELRSGPLTHYVWFHNKLAQSHSFAAALSALQGMSRTPRRYRTSTAIAALQAAFVDIGHLTHPGLAAQYGKLATQDETVADSVRLSIKQRVMSAWRRRYAIATEIVRPLRCYEETSPTENRGLLEIKRLECDVAGGECSLAEIVKSDPDLLEAMRKAVLNTGPKNAENEKRARALHEIARKPRESIAPGMCRILGDAIFVLLCPEDAIILTTNLKDFDPLAKAAGRVVQRPDGSRS